MACGRVSKAQPFTNKSSLLNITILVVDDDSATLSIVSSMLRSCKFRDSSFVEIQVTTVENSSAALSTLRSHHGIDLVITDLHMPEMDGIQLKKQIDQEFRLPVIVMSADTQKNVIQEILACGAVFFMEKPIKSDDLKAIWKYAIASKKGKSIAMDETRSNNVVPMDVPLLKTIGYGNMNSSSSSSSVNTVNEEKNNARSKKDRKRKYPSKISKEDEKEDDLARSAPKKAKVVWTNSLHNLFLQAIRHIGLEKAVPKKILEFMNVPGLTRENVASHLQKYRIFLKKVAERGVVSSALLSSRAFSSNFAFGHFHLNLPMPFNNPSSRFGSSQLGFGQSKLLNTSVPSRQSIFDRPHLYNQPNRSTYGIRSNIYGTNLLSARGNFGLGNGATQMPVFPTPNQSRSNLFQFGSPSKFGSISGTQGSGSGSGFDKTGTTKNSSCLNNPAYAGTNYAGIRINNNGDLLGIGPMRANGDGFNAGLGGNKSHGFGYLSAQEGSCSYSSGFQSMSSNVGQKSNNLETVSTRYMDDLAAIIGEDDFAYPEFDKLSLTGLDYLSCEPSNYQFNNNQKQRDETVSNPNLMDTSSDDEALNVEMNQLPDIDPNEENRFGAKETNSQDGSKGGSNDYSPSLDGNPNQNQIAGEIFLEPFFDPVWSDEDFMKSLFNDGVL